MQFVDTHCHIHEAQFELTGDSPTRALWLQDTKLDPDEMIEEAAKSAVSKLICVGTSIEDSKLAVEFAQSRANCWASVGIHPHEAQQYTKLPHFTHDREYFGTLLVNPKVVAVGECGLDYYYNHSPKADQVSILRFQIEVALKHGLPLIFHVREAFHDFWPIFDEYIGIRGVIHSFSAAQKELDEALARNLYIGLNGIMTFTKDKQQLAAARAVPLTKLLLETDAPYLTPVPFRGTINEPKHVRAVAEFLSNLRGETLEVLAVATTSNAEVLFKFT